MKKLLIVFTLFLGISSAFFAGYFAGGIHQAPPKVVYARDASGRLPLCDSTVPEHAWQLMQESGICRGWTSDDEIAEAFKP